MRKRRVARGHNCGLKGLLTGPPLYTANVNIRFYFDETGEPHIYGHGVDEEEVSDVLLNRSGTYTEDRAGRNRSRVALGKTDSGRYL